MWPMPALMVATRRGHLNIVQMLLESKKIDVNQKRSKVSILLFVIVIGIMIIMIIIIIINGIVITVLRFRYCC